MRGQRLNHLTPKAYSKRRVTSNGFLGVVVSEFATLAGLSIRLGHYRRRHYYPDRSASAAGAAMLARWYQPFCPPAAWAR